MIKNLDTKTSRSAVRIKKVLTGVLSISMVALLLWCDTSTIFARNAPVVVEGQGPICKCVLAVIFPEMVVGGYGQGTCQGDKEPIPGPPFADLWRDIRGNDQLWVKTICVAKPKGKRRKKISLPYCDNGKLDIDGAWEKKLSKGEAWYEDIENWGKEPKGDDKGTSKEAWSDPVCESRIYIKATWGDLKLKVKPGNEFKDKPGYKNWHKI